MFTLIGVIVLVLGGFIAKFASRFKKLPEQPDDMVGIHARDRYERELSDAEFVKKGLRHGGTAAVTLGFLWMVFSMITIVPDGHVAVTRAFGQYGDETLQPGFNIIMPWESTTNIDTRVKSYTFSDDSEEAISGPITAQASGGGNLLIEHTVQLAPAKETADDLLREVGTGWFDTIVLPAIRSCTRDATTGLTLEEAYTTQRAVIGTNTYDCVAEKVEPRGITMFDVLIRDVDPGAAVKQAIDAKQEAEQNLQRASITLQEEEIRAQQEAVKAFGISQAEQIVACGGVETTDADGNPVIIPNETCEDQFSAEYLQWLYINALSDVDGVVILPPEFDGNLFVQTPPSATPSN